MRILVKQRVRWDEFGSIAGKTAGTWSTDEGDPMAPPNDATRPSAATRQAEDAEARAEHDSDRAATPEEAAAAESHGLDPEVAEHEDEMLERGANQEGEGQLP
jgi:hypothetical protein